MAVCSPHQRQSRGNEVCRLGAVQSLARWNVGILAQRIAKYGERFDRRSLLDLRTIARDHSFPPGTDSWQSDGNICEADRFRASADPRPCQTCDCHPHFHTAELLHLRRHRKGCCQTHSSVLAEHGRWNGKRRFLRFIAVGDNAPIEIA